MEKIKSILNEIEASRNELVEEVRKFLRMPSISGTGQGIMETASYLKEWIENRLNNKCDLLSYGGHPIVYSKLDLGFRRTVIFYNMYDVQPVEPLELWESPPFEARIIEDKIIARGAFNTKGALMSSLLALEILLKQNALNCNVIIVLEGEEELGSPSMPKFFEDKKEELKKADLAFFAFPSERVPNKPTLILGNKGIVFIELRCKVAKYDAHSSYSRVLFNPAVILSKIVAHLIDPIEGPKIPWLEEKAIGPLEEDLKYMKDLEEALPIQELKEMYGIEKLRINEKDYYNALFFKPTVNVDGFSSGYTGHGTKTITPSEGVLRLDFRLVPNIEPEDVVEGMKKVLKTLGIEELVKMEVLDSYTWSKTSPNNAYVSLARSALEELGKKPYIVPILPGSAPSYLFTRKLGIPMISTGPGHGGRAHAPNEYITINTIPEIVKFTVLFLEKISKF